MALVTVASEARARELASERLARSHHQLAIEVYEPTTTATTISGGEICENIRRPPILMQATPNAKRITALAQSWAALAAPVSGPVKKRRNSIDA